MNRKIKNRQIEKYSDGGIDFQNKVIFRDNISFIQLELFEIFVENLVQCIHGRNGNSECMF